MRAPSSRASLPSGAAGGLLRPPGRRWSRTTSSAARWPTARTAGVIVETEAYHESEPACHAHVGVTARTHVLFRDPGTVYVYRSYGIHALVNVVCEPAGVGAAVLIRALEPIAALDAMRERRGLHAVEQLCSGPGKLTQALGIELELNGTDLVAGPLRIGPRPPGWEDVEIVDRHAHRDHQGGRAGVALLRGRLAQRVAALAARALRRAASRGGAVAPPVPVSGAPCWAGGCCSAGGAAGVSGGGVLRRRVLGRGAAALAGRRAVLGRRHGRCRAPARAGRRRRGRRGRGRHVVVLLGLLRRVLLVACAPPPRTSSRSRRDRCRRRRAGR